MSNNSRTGFDGTLSFDHAPTIEEMRKILDEYCAKWVFQRELTDSGYDHYQMRVRLKSKRRLTEMGTNNFLPTCHWSYTTKEVHIGQDFNYVMKPDTRKDGPWKNDDDVPVMTRQLREFMQHELYPWQQTMQDMCADYDDRAVDVILDFHGNSGKSMFGEYLAYRKMAVRVPPFRAMEDIMQNVMARPKYGAYLIDMPRGMKKDKLGDLYSGLECIKNGWAWDKRYEYRECTFDRPRVFVFTNCLPDYDLLSRDRWRTWQITEENILEPVSQWQLDTWGAEPPKHRAKRNSGPFAPKAGGRGATEGSARDVDGMPPAPAPLAPVAPGVV